LGELRDREAACFALAAQVLAQTLHQYVASK
jgi:hypothetical protein